MPQSPLATLPDSRVFEKDPEDWTPTDITVIEIKLKELTERLRKARGDHAEVEAAGRTKAKSKGGRRKKANLASLLEEPIG